MEEILGHLPEPEMFHYFEMLTRIPHPSGHTRQLSDWLVQFAGEQHLACRQDDAGNVVIRKPASRGREKDPVVMMQGHMDMVAASDDASFDFTKDPLRIVTDGRTIRARGTTLGGDDGIAVAMMLAVLADDSLSHPALECVFTTDEEIGMLGAAALDMSDLTASYLLNMDSESEGVITAGCAGGVCAEAAFPAHRTRSSGTKFRITVRGLLGGHSGACIHLNRVNGCRLMAEYLLLAESDVHPSLISLKAGTADNAIPDCADAVISVAIDADEAMKQLRGLAASLMEREKAREPGLQITVEKETASDFASLPPEEVSHFMKAVLALPDGPQVVVGPAGHEFVQTSLNLGILALDEKSLNLTLSVRSSEEEDKNKLRQKITKTVQDAGGTISFSGAYPGWPMKKNSPLQQAAVRVWEQLTGQKPEVVTIHAGLECGIFASKMPGLDIISFGPDMSGVHTPKEELSVESSVRIWHFLRELLQELHA